MRYFITILARAPFARTSEKQFHQCGQDFTRVHELARTYTATAAIAEFNCVRDFYPHAQIEPVPKGKK
jgi:hypothetical protein